MIVYDPVEVKSGSVASLTGGDTWMMVQSKVVILQIRFTVSTATTGSTSILKMKTKYSDYLPCNHYSQNGVTGRCLRTWGAQSGSHLFINSQWDIGVGGGLKKDCEYVGQLIYLKS